VNSRFTARLGPSGLAAADRACPSSIEEPPITCISLGAVILSLVRSRHYTSWSTWAAFGLVSARAWRLHGEPAALCHRAVCGITWASRPGSVFPFSHGDGRAAVAGADQSPIPAFPLPHYRALFSVLVTLAAVRHRALQVHHCDTGTINRRPSLRLPRPNRDRGHLIRACSSTTRSTWYLIPRPRKIWVVGPSDLALGSDHSMRPPTPWEAISEDEDAACWRPASTFHRPKSSRSSWSVR